MTAALYARRKRWPLESVTVRLRHSRVHAIDCATCDATTGMLDRIEISVEFSGALSPDQLSRLQAIAERCPVRRTLQSQIEIRAAPPFASERRP